MFSIFLYLYQYHTTKTTDGESTRFKNVIFTTVKTTLHYTVVTFKMLEKFPLNQPLKVSL